MAEIQIWYSSWLEFKMSSKIVIMYNLVINSVMLCFQIGNTFTSYHFTRYTHWIFNKRNSVFIWCGWSRCVDSLIQAACWSNLTLESQFLNLLWRMSPFLLWRVSFKILYALKSKDSTDVFPLLSVARSQHRTKNVVSTLTVWFHVYPYITLDDFCNALTPTPPPMKKHDSDAP